MMEEKTSLIEKLFVVGREDIDKMLRQGSQLT
jgi:hypothetical protein